MASFAQRNFSISGPKRDALVELRERSSPMGWYHMAKLAPTDAIWVSMVAAEDRYSQCDPRWRVESVIARDCANGFPPGQILLRDEDLFIALVEVGAIAIDQLQAATVSADGKEVVIEEVSFGGFPDGQRDLRVILALYDLEVPEEARVSMTLLTADGTYIL